MSIVSHASITGPDARLLSTDELRQRAHELRSRAETLQFSAEIALTYAEWGLEVPETVIAEVTELSSITYALERIERITDDPAVTPVAQRRQVRAELRGITGTDVTSGVAA